MGICKLVSENWTYMVSISHMIARDTAYESWVVKVMKIFTIQAI